MSQIIPFEQDPRDCTCQQDRSARADILGRTNEDSFARPSAVVFGPGGPGVGLANLAATVV